MAAVLLKGAEVAARINEEMARDIAALAGVGVTPMLVSVQVGANDASRIYRNQQEKKAASLGIAYRREDLPADASFVDVGARIQELNADRAVHGIILQTPLPSGSDGASPSLDLGALQGLIEPDKDVDGVTNANLGALMTGRPGLYPSTALAAYELITASGIALKGKECTVIGRSAIVGKPVAMLLVNQRVTVTMCHTGTEAVGMLEAHVRRAEILVVAAGHPGLIPGEWVREGAVVIDVGINYVDGVVTGDIVQGPALERAAFITPVPGGVGPLTVTMLLRNTVKAAKKEK